MQKTATSGVSASTPATDEQRVRLVLEAEIFQDPDGGPDSLIVTTDKLACEPMSPARLLGIVAKARAHLDAIALLAAQHEAATAPTPTETPRTWTFTDKDTGDPRTVTCLEGCNGRHEGDIESPTYAADIYCWNTDHTNQATLPVNDSGEPEDCRILNTIIAMDPFHANPARRVPHAIVDVIGDHYIEDLDPQGLQDVIDTFEQRLTEMRHRHAELVRIRNNFFGRRA